MAINTYNPVTPSMRHLVTVDRSVLYKGKPYKPLIRGIKRISGRNNRGVITVRSRGGGHKRQYRKVSFDIAVLSGAAVVKRLEYDPNRSAFVALIELSDGIMKYILAGASMRPGDVLSFGSGVDIKDGNCLPLREVPVGFSVFNVESKISAGAVIARSAGSYAIVSSKLGDAVQLRLRSGKIVRVHSSCYAFLGSVSNQDHKNTTIAKAGRSRWLGRRPVVRGVAMNPVDHPHGGGEGKSGTGGPPVSPWGKVAKGGRLRKRK